MPCLTSGWVFNSFPLPFWSCFSAPLTGNLCSQNWRLTDRMWTSSLVHSFMKNGLCVCLNRHWARYWRSKTNKKGSLDSRGVNRDIHITWWWYCVSSFLSFPAYLILRVFQTFSLCVLLGSLFASRLLPPSCPAYPWYQALLPRSLSFSHVLVTSLGRISQNKSSHPLLGVQSPPEIHSWSAFLVVSGVGGRGGLQTTAYFTRGPRTVIQAFCAHPSGWGQHPIPIVLVRGLEGIHITYLAGSLAHSRYLVRVYFLHLC